MAVDEGADADGAADDSGALVVVGASSAAAGLALGSGGRPAPGVGQESKVLQVGADSLWLLM